MRKHWRLIIYSLILSVIILFIYFPITRTFYQQDEWLGYGLYLAKGSVMILQNTGSILGIILGEGRILTKLLYYIFYTLFSLNIVPVAIFSILLHIFNSILVFLLAFRIFKKTIPSFLGSLFFAVNSVSQSAITWPAASVNALPSTFLVLIAIIFFINYIELNKDKWLIFSFFSIYISLFFRETGIFLFLLLPLFSILYKKYSLTKFIKTYWYFFVVVFLIIIYRLWGFKSETGEVALFLTGSSKYFVDSLVIRSIFYPITSFSLSIVPPEIFLNFARYITNVYYPFVPEAQFILVAQTVVLDLLATILSAIIAFVSFAVLKVTDSRTKKHIIFWLIFLLASFLPYVIISKSYSYLESRYYYLAAVAWAIIFAWLFHLLFEKIKNIPIKIVAVSLFAYFLFVHISILYSDIRSLVNLSQTRIQIINQIKELNPTLSNSKNILYVTGDTDYLLPGNKVPFQQGFGFTLMTIYFESGKIPKELLNENFLFEIGSQGYKEIGDYGFGYFSDIKLMEEEAKKFNIPNKNIYKFYYNSDSETVSKI